MSVCLFLLSARNSLPIWLRFPSFGQCELSLLQFDSIMSCLLLLCFEGPTEDWYSQLNHPHKIKNLLTYLLTYSSNSLALPNVLHVINLFVHVFSVISDLGFEGSSFSSGCINFWSLITLQAILLLKTLFVLQR